MVDSLSKKHRNAIKAGAGKLDKGAIANWILQEGYFPEFLLPPVFNPQNFTLKQDPYTIVIEDNPPKDPKNPRWFFDPKESKIETLTIPKSAFGDRIYGIIEPKIYHDIVWYIMNERYFVINHLFDDENIIYSYSFPIPVTGDEPLKQRRMIYEYVTAFEEDLVAESHKYSHVLHVDISKFYPSIYTHSIPWMLHEKDKARDDKKFNLLGNKIDKLIQYANNKCTNGLSIGSVVSDLIAEMLLAKIDTNVSKRLKKEKVIFSATRFKDDYRFLIKSEADANEIIKILNQELATINLHINEQKTTTKSITEGLFRKRRMRYDLISPKKKKTISFNEFRHLYQTIMDIYNEYGENGMVNRFLNELYIYQPDTGNDEEDEKNQFKAIKLTRLTSKELAIVCGLLLNFKKIRGISFPGILGIFELFLEESKKETKEPKKEEKELKNKEDQKIILDLVQTLYDNTTDNYELLWLTYWMNKHKLKPKTKTGESLLLTQVRSDKQTIFATSGIVLHKSHTKIKHDISQYLSPFLPNT